VAGAGTAVLLGACSKDSAGGGARPVDDVELLKVALDRERTSVAAYAAIGRELRGELAATARRFFDQEAEHADRLALAIRQMGAVPPRPRPRYELPRLEDGPAALRFAARLEQAAVAEYIDALPRLSEPELRATVASVITNEAEHLAVVSEALGEEPVPDAFVTGRRA